MFTLKNVFLSKLFKYFLPLNLFIVMFLLPLKKVYLYEPIPQGLSNEESKKILGAQGNLWTEYIKKPKDVEYMIIPRMTALSEVVWSPRKLRNLGEFKKRLKSFKFFYDKLNVNYRKKDF